MREYSKAEQKFFRNLISDRIKFCGCGTDADWSVTRQLLERAEDHDKNGSFYRLKEGQSSPLDEWIEFGAKVLDSWGLTEHGSSIGWAWLTLEGERLLAFIRDVGDEEMPEWTYSCEVGEEL